MAQGAMRRKVIMEHGQFFAMPTDHGSGRRCKCCNQRLSRYNPEDTCFTHTPVKLARRGRPRSR